MRLQKVTIKIVQQEIIQLNLNTYLPKTNLKENLILNKKQKEEGNKRTDNNFK